MGRAVDHLGGGEEPTGVLFLFHVRGLRSDVSESKKGIKLILNRLIQVVTIRQEVHLVVPPRRVLHRLDTLDEPLVLLYFTALHLLVDAVCIGIDVRCKLR